MKHLVINFFVSGENSSHKTNRHFKKHADTNNLSPEQISAFLNLNQDHPHCLHTCKPVRNQRCVDRLTLKPEFKRITGVSGKIIYRTFAEMQTESREKIKKNNSKMKS